MAHTWTFGPPIISKPKNGGRPTVHIAHEPIILRRYGYNIPVMVRATKGKDTSSHSNLIIWGLLDTGATKTTIDHQIANHLGLVSTFESDATPANGKPQKQKNYIVDLSFPTEKLRAFDKFTVGSIKLRFDLEKAISNTEDRDNVGLVIGRDIMAEWSVVWHGPTSTVLISD